MRYTNLRLDKMAVVPITFRGVCRLLMLWMTGSAGSIVSLETETNRTNITLKSIK